MNFIQKNRKIVLASASPRRKQLLEQLSLNFIVNVSNFDESNLYYENPSDYVINLAKGKAEAVSKNQSLSDYIVIAADTTVYFESEYLNKPENELEAKAMLKRLSNNWHSVYSGIYIIDNTNKEVYSDFSETKVKFRELNDSEIEYYIKSGSPLDKAGSYGIQDDFGAVFVEEIIGDYYNVVGLPLVKLYKILKEIVG